MAHCIYFWALNQYKLIDPSAAKCTSHVLSLYLLKQPPIQSTALGFQLHFTLCAFSRIAHRIHQCGARGA